MRASALRLAALDAIPFAPDCHDHQETKKMVPLAAMSAPRVCGGAGMLGEAARRKAHKNQSGWETFPGMEIIME